MMPYQQDMHRDVGNLVLMANLFFQQASLKTVVAAWLLGRHEVFCHLGKRCRISIWRGRPYLLSFKVVA